MDFANAFQWKLEMIFNFCKWISNNFGNSFAICANGFSRFWKWIFQDFGNGFSILEIDFRFGDVNEMNFLKFI
jgi:hypothetical protein